MICTDLVSPADGCNALPTQAGETIPCFWYIRWLVDVPHTRCDGRRDEVRGSRGTWRSGGSIGGGLRQRQRRRNSSLSGVRQIEALGIIKDYVTRPTCEMY